MPIHDWSKPDAGVFRDFHNAWYAEMRAMLNRKLLPSDYYAMIEQVTGEIVADVLTLHIPSPNGHSSSDSTDGNCAIAVATMPPKVKTKITLPRDFHTPADKQLSIRHVLGDRVVAIIEIVSRSNKSSEDELARFVIKATEAIRQKIHLLVVDLQPKTKRDPNGIHGAISTVLGDESYKAPTDKPLTLVSYVGMPIGAAYLEPVAVGDVMPSMPLFLDEGHYVNVPLEETYMNAFGDAEKKLQKELDATIKEATN